MSSSRAFESASAIRAARASSSLPCARIDSRIAPRRSSSVRNWASSSAPVASFRYRATNGTVAPPSSRSTAAVTWCSRTPSSSAMRCWIEMVTSSILPGPAPRPARWECGSRGVFLAGECRRNIRVNEAASPVAASFHVLTLLREPTYGRRTVVLGPRPGQRRLPGHPRRRQLFGCGAVAVPVHPHRAAVHAQLIHGKLSGGPPRLAAVTAAIEVERLVKLYHNVHALDGLDLEVPEGSVLGLLGPNGAGKTTCVRILATLLRPDSGRAAIRGIDVARHPQEVRRIIGLSGQYAAVDEYLTGYENLEMIGRLYHLGRKESRARAEELLERFDLTDAANRPTKTYSGGMRRRLDLAGALVARPPVLFLDEPTTGLDPHSRLGLWDIIGDRVRQGVTLLLTTQYMEEADQLADSVVVLDRGVAIARGTPDELKRQIGGERLEVVVVDRADLPAVASILKSVGTAEPSVDQEAHRVTVPVSGGVRALTEAVRQLDTTEVSLADIGVRRPTLDDVFLQLTGHVAADENQETA